MRANPYVGPRPFERGDRHNFYGRDREARELRALVVAEREVLFYAQSGAGKTSLLNAQVIPALEDKGFRVLPLARVGSELPPGIDPQAVDNVFVFSALLTLGGQDVAPQTLLDHSLNSFLQTHHPPPEARPPVLIFDQFEELFASHRHRWQEAEGFFRQVRAALDALPSLGVVFAMREDHVAEVDPYAPLFPRRLRARFRMERLGPAGALAAVRRPAKNAGCPFAPGVAERLVDDLRRTKVQRYLGTGEEVTVEGPFVEPVQLQVVCNRLWANLPEQKDSAIQWAEVEQYGDVDRALTDFYESALSLTARQTQAGERELRRWFGRQLITPMGTRGLALRGPDQTAGLPNPAVDTLEAQHLIRAEVRAGARWYELAHDRLIEPIRESNQGWEAARETPLRAAARRWEETNDAALLYRGDALERAQTWVEAHPDQAEAFEVTFLEASQQAKQERDRRRRLRRTAIIGLVLGLVLMVVVSVLLYRGEQRAHQTEARAQEQRGTAVAEAATAAAAEATAEARRQEAEAAKAQAEAQRQIALARQLAAQAQLAPDGTGAGATRGLLLAVESLRHAHTLEGDQALRQGLARLPRLITQKQQESSVEALAFSPDGRHLASAGGRWGRSGEAWVSDLETDQVIAHFEFSDVVLALAFSPDGQWLATGSADGTVQVWDLSTGQEIAKTYFLGDEAYTPPCPNLVESER